MTAPLQEALCARAVPFCDSRSFPRADTNAGAGSRNANLLRQLMQPCLTPIVISPSSIPATRFRHRDQLADVALARVELFKQAPQAQVISMNHRLQHVLLQAQLFRGSEEIGEVQALGYRSESP